MIIAAVMIGLMLRDQTPALGSKATSDPITQMTADPIIRGLNAPDRVPPYSQSQPIEAIGIVSIESSEIGVRHSGERSIQNFNPTF